jgi:NitT/TauT family transport system substrate-binding protein
VRKPAAIVAALALVCVVAAAAAAAPRQERTKVTLQLNGPARAQFAGYYAARAKGFYEQAGLDVTIRPGGPNITPEQVVAFGQAEFGVGWLAPLLAARDQGRDLVNIAQIFARSGLSEVAWSSSGIAKIEHLAGKRVGAWCCGSEFGLFAALARRGIDPKKPSEVTIVNQPADMKMLLERKVDAAAAMTYNELAQILETRNPKTGKLYQLADLNVIRLESAGTALLEDGIFARGDWLADPAHRDTATRFLAASMRGWIHCRDLPDECVRLVLSQGRALRKGRQTWQLNEVNALIWPNARGIGVMNPAAFARTSAIARQFRLVQRAPQNAYRTDIAREAVASLRAAGVDVLGKRWKKAAVKVTPGGR